MVRVDMNQIRRAIRNLNITSDEINRVVQDELVATALVDVETFAKDKITSDGHVVTGRLRASIHTETLTDTTHNYTDSEGQGFNGSLQQKPKNLNEVFVGTNVIYAMKIERLDSFMRAAYVNGKSKINDNVKRALRRTLR